MKYIEFENYLDASYSFALEEYIMKNAEFKDEYFLFWNTKPTLMIGRFQNTIEEINMDFAKSENMDIIRRNSGGGTIYTDENCWQFSFITWKDGNKVKNFRDFTKPIIDALQKLGINSWFSGRNDLMLGEKKFSGNAQFSYKNRFLHHGSILFNANLENLVKAISPSNEKIISKGIKSIKERVVNLKDFLNDKNINTFTFRDRMLEILKQNMEIINLSEKNKEEVKNIEKNKFLTWDWNFGLSPDFNYSKSLRFAGGKVDINLNVSKGYIKDCKIFGDFFFNGDIKDLENNIINCKYEKNELLNLFNSFNIENYFYQIKCDELIECFF